MPPRVKASPVNAQAAAKRMPFSGLELALELRTAELLLAAGLLTPESLAVSLLEQARVGGPLGDVLIAEGGIRPLDYYRALARAQALPFVNLRESPADATLLDPRDRLDFSSLNLVPWRREGDRVRIAATLVTERQLMWARERYGPEGFAFAVTSPFDILWQTQSIFRDLDSRQAREALYEKSPEHSANQTIFILRAGF